MLIDLALAHCEEEHIIFSGASYVPLTSASCGRDHQPRCHDVGELRFGRDGEQQSFACIRWFRRSKCYAEIDSTSGVGSCHFPFGTPGRNHFHAGKPSVSCEAECLAGKRFQELSYGGPYESSVKQAKVHTTGSRSTLLSGVTGAGLVYAHSSSNVVVFNQANIETKTQ